MEQLSWNALGQPDAPRSEAPFPIPRSAVTFPPSVNRIAERAAICASREVGQQQKVGAVHRFFGYGSLVNRATHEYPEAAPAVLHGWQRVWVQTRQRDIAFLSAQPNQNSTVEGLVAAVPGGDWSALDKRESAYVKHPVSTSAGAAHVYAVPDHNKVPAGEITLLLSYLDVVVQGFLAEFGEAGVARFFETTENWSSNVTDDRAEPIYPRAQRLSSQERALVDHWLNRVV